MNDVNQKLGQRDRAKADAMLDVQEGMDLSDDDLDDVAGGYEYFTDYDGYQYPKVYIGTPSEWFN